MGTQFVPLEVNLIDEGELIEELNDKLKEAFQALRSHRLNFGDKAEKATAEVSCSVKLICQDVNDGTTAISWAVQVKRPKRPTTTSIAIDGYDDEGKATLFVRASGSDDGDPRQLKLATKDGREVDTATGEAEPR